MSFIRGITKMFNASQLEQEIFQLQEKKIAFEELIKNAQSNLGSLESKVKSQKYILQALESSISLTRGRIIGEEIKAYSYPAKRTSSQQLESQLKVTEDKISSMIIEDNLISHASAYTVDGSITKGRDFQKFYGESLIMSFNNYFDKKAKSITVSNYDHNCELIKSYFNKMNKRANVIGDSLNEKYLVHKLATLKILLDIKIVSSEERTREIEERRKLREEEKLLQEIEKEKAELATQRRMYQQSLTKALNEAERIEFEAKLKEIDKRESDIDYRLSNKRAGYLYITASDSMPNITKIGATRQLNPLVRIHELSSASVPFPFVCFGLTFSDDVFDLEAKIHEYFNNKRVNKTNRHKEFFEITPQEAIDVLRNKFKCEVHFVDEVDEESEEV